MLNSSSTITTIVEHESIINVLHLAVMGFTNDDVSLRPDVVFDLHRTGFKTIQTETLGCVGPMAATCMISNSEAEFKASASITSLSALTLAQHCLSKKR